MKNYEALRVQALFKAGYTIGEILEETQLSLQEVRRLKEEGDFEYKAIEKENEDLKAEVAALEAGKSGAESRSKNKDRDIQDLTEERNGFKAKIDNFEEKGCAVPKCPSKNCKGHLSYVALRHDGKVCLSCDKCDFVDWQWKHLNKKCNMMYYHTLVEQDEEELLALAESRGLTGIETKD